MKKVKFKDLPQRMNMQGLYRIDVFWNDIERCLDSYKQHYNLKLNPDFQRGHIWDDNQQIKYVEFIISGGITGKDVFFNYPNWQGTCDESETMVCVDGLQRLTAVRKFMKNKFKIFGKHYAKSIDKFSLRCGFKFHVNNLIDRKDILQWYLEMNEGGTPHSKKELKKVRGLLKEAK